MASESLTVSERWANRWRTVAATRADALPNDGGKIDAALSLPNRRIDCSLRRHYVDEFHRTVFSRVPAGTRVIDVGGHRDCKRGAFDIRQYDVHVVCVNQSDSHGTDVVADAAQLPFATASCEMVLCSELLEHVIDPIAVLCEAFRVLQPGGRLVACSPFLYHLHADPHDFGRFTDHYWRKNLQDLGFVDIEVSRQGGFWSVVCDMVRHVTYHSKPHRWHLRMLRSLVRRMIGHAKQMAYRWDTQQTTSNRALAGFTTGFAFCAAKPEKEQCRST